MSKNNFTTGDRSFSNEFGARMEVISIEPSIPVETMCWYNPCVDVRVRVYDDIRRFSVSFTINRYVVPDEYLPENWHQMDSGEIWGAVSGNLWNNLKNLNVLNAIIPLDCSIESAIETYYEENELDDDTTDDDVVNALLDESNWDYIDSSMVYDFKVLKYNCDVPGNILDDYITDFKVER